jgi:hypothetical protein
MQFGAFGEAGRRGQEEGRVHGRRLRLATWPIFPILRTIGGDTGSGKHNPRPSEYGLLVT